MDYRIVPRPVRWMPAIAAALLIGMLVGGGLGQAAEYPLDLLQYRIDPDGTTTGEVVRNYIGVEDNHHHRLRIGIFEEVSGGVGPSLRASAWMASIVASSVADVDLFDYTIYFDFPGVSDGPSAGAMKTVALLAIWLGHELSPDVVMTGTINPDGSIGPVGGIKEKIEAAASMGKQRVLIPIGQRLDYDEDGELIDHVELGEALGIDVRIVGSIYEAYPLITGEPLPRPADVLAAADEDVIAAASFDGSEPTALTLSESAFQLVMSSFLQWDLRLEDILSELRDLGVDTVDVEAMQQQAWETLGAGHVSVAYNQIVETTMFADALMQAHIVQLLLAEDGLLEVLEYVEFNSVPSEFAGYVYELVSEAVPEDMGDVPALMEAGAAAASAIGIWMVGNFSLDELYWTYDFEDDLEYFDDETIEAILDEAYAILMFFRLTEWFALMATDYTQLALPSDVDMAAWDEVDRLGRLYTAGLVAVSEYLDAIALDEMAAARGMRLEPFREELAAVNWDYAVAFGAVRYITEGPGATSLLRLGAAGSTYHDMANMLTAYYSLGAYFDEDGVIVEIGLEESLEPLLVLAEEAAIASVAGARRLGVESIPSLMYLEQARHYMSGTLDEQIHALGLLWQADFLAKTVLRLAN